MIALFRKEIAGFFNNLTGYVLIIIINLVSGLAIWILPGENNILDNGYASLAPLFINAPWILGMLAPAITMKAFAEEKRLGTLDSLLARPLKELEIVLAKYFACLTLILIALAPTLIFFISVYLLGSPVGNIDTGGTWGSYLGLIFLAAAYCSIGIYASSITNNLILSFILSLFICGIIYSLPGFLAGLFSSGNLASIIHGFSASTHFQSMSRGIIDSRDLVYFLSIVTLFTTLTIYKLKSRS